MEMHWAAGPTTTTHSPPKKGSVHRVTWHVLSEADLMMIWSRVLATVGRALQMARSPRRVAARRESEVRILVSIGSDVAVFVAVWRLMGDD